MSTHHPTFSRSSGFGNVFKSISKSLRANNKNDPIRTNPTVVGGGDDRKALFDELTYGTVSQRASAAERLTKSLNKYSISSIPEVWYLVSDLCKSDMQSGTRRIALKLMIECIHQNDGSESNRLLFFKDITRYCELNGNKVDKEFDLFLEALNVLTDEGKDIHYFCIYDDEKDFTFFIQTSLNLLGDQYIDEARKSSENSTESSNTLSNLLGLLKFLQNCFKINFNLFTDDIVSKILLKLTYIGCETSDNRVIMNILDVLNSVIIFGDMSSGLIPEILKLFALHYSLDEELDNSILDLIFSLSSDMRVNLVIPTLCTTMVKPEIQQRQAIDSSISKDLLKSVNSFHLVISVYLNEVFEKSIGIDCMLAPILSACKEIFQKNIPSVVTPCLRTLDKFLLKDLYDENFGLVFTDSFDQLLPFYYFHSSTNSFFSTMKSIRLNSEQDQEYFSSISLSLLHLFNQNELKTPKSKLINFYMGFHQFISPETIPFILDYYKEERLCTALNPEWKENCSKLLKCFCYEETDVDIKIECLNVIIHGLEMSNVVIEMGDHDYDILCQCFERMLTYNNDKLIEYLMKEVFGFIANFGTFQSFKSISEILLQAYIHNNNITQSTTATSHQSVFSGSIASTNDKSYSSKNLACIGENVIFIFLSTLTHAPERTCLCYDLVIKLFEMAFNAQDTSLMLTLSKGLIRLRVTNENKIYFTEPVDMNGLAATFKRALSESPTLPDSYKWVYPESLEYIPNKLFDRPSNVKISSEADDKSTSIDVSHWLGLVLKIMNNFVDWELYTFIWAHFCVQLSNVNLFKRNRELIVQLMNVICNQLCLNLPKSLKLPEKMTKADLQVAYVRNLSALIGYHDIFSKQEEDHIVNSLIYGLGSWEKTAIPCINILTVCCYEIPLSIQKFLSIILTKLQTTVTHSTTSFATLEFLMSLIHLPTLTSNFTSDELKIVFGIAFKYIQHSNDMKKGKISENGSRAVFQQHGIDAQVAQTPSTNSIERSPVLSSYLLSMSYHVISCWFLKISMNERKHFSSFLVKNIILSSENPNELDHETLAYLDFITRFTFSDVPLKMMEVIKHEDNVRVETNKWIIGNTIFAIQTDTFAGSSLLIVRRPTGTSIFNINMTGIDSSQKPVVSPNSLILELFNNLDNTTSIKPIALIDDSLTTRALAMIDRTPTLNYHKIGILYSQMNQSEEIEILKNEVGSRAYFNFLRRVGSLIKLKGCKGNYVGGLDTERDQDGEHAIFWSDKTTQVIFHTTTMMKNNENDQFCDLKKRHIGNNYVNIFFDESNLPFNFNVVKSQFNFINIVISPHTMPSTSLHADAIPESYKVKVYRRSGVPGVFAACHFKIISEKQLPIFVRNVAIMADRFASVWHSQNNGRYVSNWGHRVKQIATLKEKTIRNHDDLRAEQQQSTANLASNSASTTKSFLDQLQSGDYNIIPNNDTKYEYLTGSENEIYSLFEFNSYVS